MSNKRRKRSILSKSFTTPQVTPSSNLIKKDGWSNVLTNLGSQESRVNTTTYVPMPRLDRQTLTNIYTNDSIARQIVNIIVDDAMRGFISAEDSLLDELARIKAKQKIIEAATWARLYGGSALVAFADDGQEMENPLNLDRLKKVVSIQSYDRAQITWIDTDINQDFYSEHYGHPEVYTITPSSGGAPFKVHRSRMHLFGGERIPPQQYLMNGRWDDSILQSLYPALKNYGQTMNACAEIIQDYVQVILSVDGLTDMLRSGNEDQILKRLKITDMTRSVSNTIMLDAQYEKYAKHASSVAGLADILEKQQELLSAGSRITMTRLFSTNSKGLGTSGLNDPDNWNNTVEAYRGDELQPCIDWLIDMVEAQSLWTEKPESFDWSFPALKVSNEHEIAKNRLMAAQVDQIYISAGANPDLLFKKRYTPGGFETDIFISEEEMAEAEGENDISNNVDYDLQKSIYEVKGQIAEENKVINNKANIEEDKKNQKVLDRQLTKVLIDTLGSMKNEK